MPQLDLFGPKKRASSKTTKKKSTAKKKATRKKAATRKKTKMTGARKTAKVKVKGYTVKSHVRKAPSKKRKNR